MKICGIICEFNPLHNGHEYLISSAKEMGYEVLCLMSGNFTQRGIPAIQDKYTRAANAIKAGASIVIELPFIYSVNSADQFSAGSIKILKALGVDSIIFGSECGEKSTLEKIAKLKLNETPSFKKKLKNEMKQGISYNQAYINVMSIIIPNKSIISSLTSSNDILASSYIKEIKKQKANISYHVIKRTDNGYNSTTPNKKFLSASSICSMVKDGQNINEYIPSYTQESFNSIKPFNYDTMMNILTHTLTNINENQLNKIYEIKEGLEFLLKNNIINHTNYDEYINSLISKRYRKSRINKLLLYTLINLTKREYKLVSKQKPTVSVLAVDKNKKQILSKISKSKINLVVNQKDYNNLNNKHKLSIDIDQRATNFYNICIKKPISKSIIKGAKFI